jgi:hypothetical protein
MMWHFSVIVPNIVGKIMFYETTTSCFVKRRKRFHHNNSIVARAAVKINISVYNVTSCSSPNWYFVKQIVSVCIVRWKFFVSVTRRCKIGIGNSRPLDPAFYDHWMDNSKTAQEHQYFLKLKVVKSISFETLKTRLRTISQNERLTDGCLDSVTPWPNLPQFLFFLSYFCRWSNDQVVFLFWISFSRRDWSDAIGAPLLSNSNS